jgi:ATP-dependent Clp protease ATP-binding subunit ClpC
LFERFDPGARRVVVEAQEQSRLLDHDHIGTEHLLLGLVLEANGIAARALRELDVSVEAVAAQVDEVVGRGGGAAGLIPFTANTKDAFERAHREAKKAGSTKIKTEHLLLGIVSKPRVPGRRDSAANRVLRNLGVDRLRVRRKVEELGYGHLGG